VASSFGQSLRAGDEIVLSEMEHHANIVPWHFLRERKGVVLRFAPVRDDGSLDMEAFRALLGPKTRLVAISHMSNVLGTINPAVEIVAEAHAAGVPVLLDGCQAIVHSVVDVQALDADFYVFSCHKLYGPTGIGVLYGKRALLDKMPPYQGGGDMIASVTFEETIYNDLPYKFEAGTPDIAGAIGLGAAVDFVTQLGIERIAAHELSLLALATDALSQIPGITLHGTAPHKAGVLSFTLQGVHPHDLGTILDHEGVAIRAGHHCAMPLMDLLGVPATARASFGCYSTAQEVEQLTRAVNKAREVFS
jgi:cysteine desulfurase/selenocysteine lyase